MLQLSIASIFKGNFMEFLSIESALNYVSTARYPSGNLIFGQALFAGLDETQGDQVYRVYFKRESEDGTQSIEFGWVWMEKNRIYGEW